MTNSLLASFKSRYQNISVKAGIWYTIANFAQKGVDFVTIPIFLNLLSPEEYGSVSIFLIWAAVLSIVFPLQVQSAIGRAKYDFNETEYSGFISSTLTLGNATSLLFLSVLILLPADTVFEIFRISKLYLFLAGFSALGLTSIETYLQKWRFSYQYVTYTVISILLAVFRFSFSILAILILPGLSPSLAPDLSRIVGLVIVNIVFGFLLLGKGLLSGKVFFNTAYWKYAVSFSVPLIPHLLASMVLSQSDRILIERYVDLSAAGLYSFAYQAGSVIYLLWISINGAWVPWFYDRMSALQVDTIRTRGRQYLAGFTAVTILIMVVVPPLLKLIIPESYWPGLQILPVIIAGLYFYLPFSFYVNIEYYEKKTFTISIGTILAAAVNLVLNILLIPRLGYEAAAWTTLAGYFLLFIFHAAVVRYQMPQHRHIFSFWLMLGCSLAVVTLAVLIALLL